MAVRRESVVIRAVDEFTTPVAKMAAAAMLLDSFADAFTEWLAAITMPALVVCGSEDDDNGSGRDLAATLPDATFAEVPGTHMSSITKPEFGAAIAGFLAA